MTDRSVVLADIIGDGLSGMSGEVFHGVGVAVVAVLTVQPGHGGDVLCDVWVYPGCLEPAQPALVGYVDAGDGSIQCVGVLGGELVEA